MSKSGGALTLDSWITFYELQVCGKMTYLSQTVYDTSETHTDTHTIKNTTTMHHTIL